MADKKQPQTTNGSPANPTPDGNAMLVQIDDRNMTRSYANAYRTHTMPEEVLVDFGLNMIVPSQQDQAKEHILFEVDHRIVLNYYTAKRLAITLGQIVRMHEEQFGEMNLDAAQRARNTEAKKS